MTAFEDLKSEWKNQNQVKIPNDGAKEVLKTIKSVQKKQQITNIVLATTGAVLIAFFFYVSAYKYGIVTFGLLLMNGALVLRIGLELSSIKSLEKMNIFVTIEAFKQQMIHYYKKRIKVHYIWTPIIIVLYIMGFVMLLPSFKQSLSSGFYTYVIVSSIVLLVVFGLFIWKQIRLELSILKDLKQD